MAKDTRIKWFNKVESYRSSNLSLKEWCEKNNIVHSTMRSWVTKYNKANKTIENSENTKTSEF